LPTLEEEDMRPRTAARFTVSAILFLLLAGQAATAAAREPGQAPEQVKTAVTLTQVEMMLGAKDDFTTWDLSVAVGTYVQTFGERDVKGRIIDLGALQLPDGSTYPMLMAEGRAMVVRTEAVPQPIAKISNAQNLILAADEKVWGSPDGKTSVLLARGTFYLVLDPKGFPKDKKVIGIADSKLLYLYPTQ
jgi:hypothetical protein